MKKKIAFCFLIYNKIEFEEIWYEFFKNANPLRYNIYIHYKDKYELEYFKDNVLQKCIPTQYAKVSLVHATNLLFEEAYKDKDNYKFILLCGTTIPLKNFDYVYEMMTKDSRGNMNYIDTHSVCHQWVIFNRQIIKEILLYGNEGFQKLHKDTYGCPDEVLYIKFIKNKKLEKEIKFTDNLYEGATMFVNWGKYEYKYNKEKLSKYPKNYKKIIGEEIDYLLNSKSLFGRKFLNECIIEDKNIKLSEYLLDFIKNNQYKFDYNLEIDDDNEEYTNDIKYLNEIEVKEEPQIEIKTKLENIRYTKTYGINKKVSKN